MSFHALGLSDELLAAVEDSGYTEPTAIQRQAIPLVLMGRDIIGVAQTGTGKTASFVLPLIDILAHGRGRARMPRSLIIAPTRELADQVAQNFLKYGKNHNLSMALLIGGVGFGDQDKALEKGVDVLIATPGRLLDQFERGKILLSGVDILVIDEADRMLDMGFIPDVERICSLLGPNRQSLLFSATMAAPIKKLADRFLKDPRMIEVARQSSTNANIAQSLQMTGPREKKQALRALLRAEEVTSAIVFCNRKRDVKELVESLKRDGFRAGQIHGDMEQRDRLSTLEDFKADRISILVASDVAARGLDIKGVSHVFNFDVPFNAEDYVHRIGRTGRAGKTGIAVTLVTSADTDLIADIEKLIGTRIERRGAVPQQDDSAKSAAKPADTDADSNAEKDARPAGSRARGGKRARGGDRKPEVPRAEVAPKAAPKPAARPAREEDSDDGGWNGPLPDFLSVSARG
ncbi:DEAD/DEAH box helicase [Sphingosinicella microcystinivorans]|uniref:Superfamily II DNA/RNA helicase n=1 Tax=Sphingosinicella microcystinivorans TaxID=335406 RepID=A0ABX9SUP1_SPHMI|nr:DEAD/DEAH box helicase [Sphingosinicella microcystinivorans]RKS84997.1 superfamily II DNA/RNA helicase [Sphingosinicella microcystinivorans]